VVTVRSRIDPAMIDSDGVLVDPACNKGVRFEVQRRTEAHQDQASRDFSRYLNEGRTVEATVSGRFEMILVVSGEPLLVFRLVNIAGVIPGLPFLPLQRKPM
jgi:hypothetical protein